ncbi:MAG TPA: hypothetical protein VF103_03715 [Polyangiaceae bacterium]
MRLVICAAFVPLMLATFACGSEDPETHGVGGSGAGGASGKGGGTSKGGTAGTGGTIIPQGGASGASGAAGTGTGGTGMPDLDTDVNVIITADNAYGFGYGTGTEVLNYFGGIENPRSQDIFSCPVGMGPESYVVPAGSANEGEFLYIIAYADKSTTQGVIAKFFREGAQPVFTGNGNWQVCATGQDRDPGDGGPDLAQINEQLAICNAGGSDPETTSGGWVGVAPTQAGNVVFGEDNSTDRGTPMPGNEFLIACDIDPEARWMWYEWETNRTSGSPFMWPGGTANVTKDFLIFRLGAEFIPGDPR